MKMNKRFMSALMAFLVCMSFVSFSAYAADGAISAAASASTVEAGETFTVDVSIDTNPGITFFKAWVTYTDGLELKSATDATLLNTPLLDSNYTNPYAITWADGLATDNNTKTGKLVTLTFTVKDVATGAQTVTITSEPASCNDVDFEELDFGAATATVTVKANAPTTTDVVIATPNVETSEVVDGYFTAGALAEFTVGATNNAVKEVKFVLNNGEADKEYVADLKTTVTSGTVKVALNVVNVPEGKTITVKSVAPVAIAAN